MPTAIITGASRGLGLALALALAGGLSATGLLLRATLAVEDAVDELGLAQAAKAVEPQLAGDGVQVGKGAGLERGAREDGHVRTSVGRRWAPDRVGQRPATGT